MKGVPKIMTEKRKKENIGRPNRFLVYGKLKKFEKIKFKTK